MICTEYFQFLMWPVPSKQLSPALSCSGTTHLRHAQFCYAKEDKRSGRKPQLASSVGTLKQVHVSVPKTLGLVASTWPTSLISLCPQPHNL